jgi:hypothetical protein
MWNRAVLNLKLVMPESLAKWKVRWANLARASRFPRTMRRQSFHLPVNQHPNMTRPVSFHHGVPKYGQRSRSMDGECVVEPTSQESRCFAVLVVERWILPILRETTEYLSTFLKPIGVSSEAGDTSSLDLVIEASW